VSTFLHVSYVCYWTWCRRLGAENVEKDVSKEAYHLEKAAVGGRTAAKGDSRQFHWIDGYIGPMGGSLDVLYNFISSLFRQEAIDCISSIRAAF
jgi:hypothetical protein